MNARVGPALVALAAFALASACAPSRPPAVPASQPATSPDPSASFTDADRQAVGAMLEDQRAAWNRGDLDGFMDAYENSEELVFTSGGHVRRGWQTTMEKYRARYGDDRATMGQLEFEILDIRGLGQGGDAAVVLGKWRLAGPLPGHGVFTLVCERTPDGWRVVHDHTSAGPDEPSEPGAASPPPE